jgi:Membrane dipeptidase (Peptidase family M19)
MTIHLSPIAAPRARNLQHRGKALLETSVNFVNFARIFPMLLCAMFVSFAAPAYAQIDPATQARIDRILKNTPLIDGHNDIAEQLGEYHESKVEKLASGTDKWPDHPLMTDMARLHAGRVGGQFWSVYIDGTITGDAAIRRTLEQIDIVHRMIAAYPGDLELARTADDIVRIHKTGKIASLIGIEGGRQIGGNLPALRLFYQPQSDDRMGRQRDRRPQIQGPVAIRVECGRRDEPAGHARRPQPCLACRNEAGDHCQPCTRDFLAQLGARAQ